MTQVECPESGLLDLDETQKLWLALPSGIYCWQKVVLNFLI